jgi:hypothetical protein
MKTTLNITAVLASTVLAIAIAIPSCNKLDVVGNDSARAFNDLLQNANRLISEDTENGGWSLSAPDNSARFVWSKDFSKSPKYDAMLVFDAAPFIAAGLDPSKLPADFTLRGDTLITGAKLGSEQLRYDGVATPLASYEHIVKQKRDAIGYHGALDHYGINLGGGNLFEWAKNLKTNDKDIVFVLDPEPFLRAGVDPNKVDGWAFAKVTVDDENGRPVQVDKILKPFDLL